MGLELAHTLLNNAGHWMTISLSKQGLNILVIKTTENRPEKKRMAILTAYGLGGTFGAVLPFSSKHEKEVNRISLVLMESVGLNP